MATRNKRGLGRGLESLISADLSAEADRANLVDIDLDELRPGRYQPRQSMDDDALEALAQSIRTQGVVQPLVARADNVGYEIIAGERRWRAARLAGLTRVPVVVRGVPDDAALTIALIENIQREDLNSVEQAQALSRLIHECGLTHAGCAEAVGRSRASVSNLLRLLDLTEPVRDHLRAGAIEMGHARALLGLAGQAQIDAADAVVARGLTVRQTERLVRDGALDAAGRSRSTRPPGDPRVDRLAQRLGQRLDKPVDVVANRRGGGRVSIRYKNAADLEQLMQALGVDE